MPPLTSSRATTSNLEKGIASVLLYYDLLDYPLTALEIFRYLGAQNEQVSFYELKMALAQSRFLNKISETEQGLYFLKGRQELIELRETKLKISQLKWKKLKKLAKPLAFIPFLRLAAVSGSLTLNNATPQSDFDLLIITKANRLWTARIIITAILTILGKRRHGLITKDRFCLNCYLAQNNLEIKKQAKPRNFHSAQEYGRINLLIEKEPGLYRQFLQNNHWLKAFLANYPWQNQHTAKIIYTNQITEISSNIGEKTLSGRIGDWLENRLGVWQTKRIKSKTKNEAADQVFFSNECLMFHPQSKSYPLMEKYNAKIAEIL